MAVLLALIRFSDPVVVSKVSSETKAFIGRPCLLMTEMQGLELALCLAGKESCIVVSPVVLGL